MIMRSLFIKKTISSIKVARAFFLLLFVFFPQYTHGNEILNVVNVVNPPETITISASSSVIVDWGDGTASTKTVESGQAPVKISHTYDKVGVFTISTTSAAGGDDTSAAIFFSASATTTSMSYATTTYTGTSTSVAANMMCAPVIKACGCHMTPCLGGCCASDNMWLCKCENTTNKQVSTGFCSDTHYCQTTVSSGKPVDTDQSKLTQAVTQAIEKIAQENAALGGGGVVGGEKGGSSSSQASGTSLCTSVHQVSVPSTDPCAVYVPPSTLGTGLIRDLFTQTGASRVLSGIVPAGFRSSGASNGQTPTKSTDDLLGSTASLIADPAKLVLNVLGNTSVQGTIKGTEVKKTPITKPSLDDLPEAVVPAPTIAMVSSGSKSPLSDTYMTVTEEARPFNSNNAVSGFSSDASGARRPGFFAWLCQARPWASEPVAPIVPGTFFDGLCASGGYQIGRSSPSMQTLGDVLTQGGSVVPAGEVTRTSSRVLVRSAAAQIWAEPATVPIGSRATIFWKTTGVDTCIVTTADGSFYQTALIGGASTVPLTTATTYFISCATPDGATIGESVTVRMAI